MSTATTEIAWTDRTWNPVRGCSRVSPGCDNCYAMGVAHRFAGTVNGKPGPYAGLTTIRKGKVDWSGQPRFIPSALAEPLSWRKPQRVFVNSMSDLFHHSVTNEEIAAVFGAMAACPHITFQVLTKRAKRMREWFEWAQSYADGPRALCAEAALRHDALEERECRAVATMGSRLFGGDERPWPLPNVWLGVSAENQETADERIPDLLRTPAAVRFVSAEPLLGPLDLRKYLNVGGICECPSDAKSRERCEGKGRKGWIRCNAGMRRINWVIVGGESGRGARPCALEWIEQIRKHCAEQLGMGKKPWPVPCFVKQLGSCVVSEQRTATAEEMRGCVSAKGQDWQPGPNQQAPNGEYWAWRAGTKHPKGGDPTEYPDLFVRQFPETRP